MFPVAILVLIASSSCVNLVKSRGFLPHRVCPRSSDSRNALLNGIHTLASLCILVSAFRHLKCSRSQMICYSLLGYSIRMRSINRPRSLLSLLLVPPASGIGSSQCSPRRQLPIQLFLHILSLYFKIIHLAVICMLRFLKTDVQNISILVIINPDSI